LKLIRNRVVDYSAARLIVHIEWKQHKVQVDVSLIAPHAWNTGNIYQFIGEVQPASECDSRFAECAVLSLQARLARSLDGVDLALYQQAQQRFRELLARSPV
jgi:hypothetical protein